MGRPDAFYIPTADFAAPFALTDKEAGHCTRVLRKKVGDTVRAFDGQGREGLFHITGLSRDRVDLEPETLTATPRGRTRVYLAAGFSRASRRDYFLEKAVEMGAAGVFFWQATHSQGHMPESPKESWIAALIAAAKQCGAAWLPELAVIPDGATGLVTACDRRFDRRFLLWEAPDLDRRLTLDDVGAAGTVLFILGPEGGLTDAEAGIFLESGALPVSLGKRVLRWETAALAVLALGLLASP